MELPFLPFRFVFEMQVPMKDYKLTFPQHFAEREWEIESKGWLSSVFLEFEGKRYSLMFYDPVRLSQEAREDIQRDGLFFEKNLILVESVTKAAMEKAIAYIIEAGMTNSLVQDPISLGGHD